MRPSLADKRGQYQRPEPRTDPTNPYSQETTGVNEPGRRENERAVVEPGLTERDRDARGHAWEARSKPESA
jgi:hypothetical protein